ncbi:MAG TPA: endopeptidase La, partial [Gammaproteobacteria bacterium]|nr:endopeptidase La [Gammaproteobacteria bacterium]
MSEDTKNQEMTSTDNHPLPVLPLRDVVVFPNMVIPLFVGREKSIAALDRAMDSGKNILLLAQKDAADDDPAVEELYTVGTLASILQLLKLPDGTVKVLVEGGARTRALEFTEVDECFMAVPEVMPIVELAGEESDVLMRTVLNTFEQYVKLNNKIPPEVLNSLSGIDEAGRLADTIAAHLNLKLDEKQQILEVSSEQERLEHLLGTMDSEIDLLQVEKRIRGRVKKQMEKSQR